MPERRERTRGGHAADVAIIGHGLVGCVAARCLLDAGLSVILIEAGSPASDPPGTHLRNLAACASDRSFYHELVRAQLRARVDSPAQERAAGTGPLPMADGNGVNSAQRPAVNLPAASSTNLAGGMGALWNGVALRLDPDREGWPGICAVEWNELYDRAEAMLGVGLAAAAGSARQEYVLRALAALPGAAPVPVPLAARRSPGDPRGVCWTGPAEILAGIGGPAGPGEAGLTGGTGLTGEAGLTGETAGRLEVLWEHAVRRLDHRGGRVLAAEVVDLRGGAATTVRAEAFLVAAGGIRTPALLWSSDIVADGADAPLGRYLCDHPLAYAQLVLDPEALGSPARAGAGPDPDPVVLLPMSAGRPFHALLQCDAYDVRVLEGRIDSRLLLSLYWYTSAAPRFENRVIFSHEATDAFGLPQPTFEYRLSAEERDRQQAAVADLRAVGQRLGTFLPGSPPRLLSPGSSLHVMGTTRMGQADDGQSVTDLSGRVWGFDNLYLGGTGLIPSATATNPTLAACALAIRAAAAITGY